MRFVGLDAHKETTAVAVCEENGHCQSLGTIPNTPEAVARLLRKLGSASSLRAAYEAGPCGYVLYRQMQKLGIPCIVAAQTPIPVRAGDRVKTGRRDAVRLARFRRTGDLVPVWVPDEAHQALRDLLRCRLTAQQDLKRARNRLTKFLWRQGFSESEGAKPFGVWLRTLQLSHASKQTTLQDYLLEAEHQEQRLTRLGAELPEQIPTLPEPMQRVIAALKCLHGGELLTAATVVAEVGELERFHQAGQLFSYAGLVPSEHSSGGPAGQRRGGLTKTGNAQLRRVLVESAWHVQRGPGISAALRKRRLGQDPKISQSADRAHKRLYRKFSRMEQKNKPSGKAATAVSRELLGFLWPSLPSKHFAPPCPQAVGHGKKCTTPCGSLDGASHIRRPGPCAK